MRAHIALDLIAGKAGGEDIDFIRRVVTSVDLAQDAQDESADRWRVGRRGGADMERDFFHLQEKFSLGKGVASQPDRQR